MDEGFTPFGSVAADRIRVYGDGSDGAVNFDGVTTPVAGATLAGSTYTLARDVHATTLVVAAGVIIKTVGWKMFATTSMVVNGTLNFDGNNAAAAVAGAAVQKTVASVAGATGVSGAGAT